MSSSVVSGHWNTSHSITDHWRALRLANVSSVFDLSSEHDVLKYLTRPEMSTDLSYCDELSTDCYNGFYHSQQCPHRQNNCAVLLSSYPGNPVYLDCWALTPGFSWYKTSSCQLLYSAAPVIDAVLGLWLSLLGLSSLLRCWAHTVGVIIIVSHGLMSNCRHDSSGY